MTKLIPWHTIQSCVEHQLVFEPVRSHIQRFGDEWPNVSDYNKLFKEVCPNFDFIFVDQKSKPPTKVSGSLRAYIEGAAVRREISTRRHHVHDLFNFLTYVLFPKTKTKILQLHFQESATMESPPALGGRGRTRLQDLLTLFDEGGAIYQDQPSSEFLVFGHGILEQFIVNPQAVRAMTWIRPGVHQSEFKPLSQSISEIDSKLELLMSLHDLSDSTKFQGQWLPEEFY